MFAHPDVGPVAALIGEPTRAAILVGLLDGRARTAGELASVAGVSPQGASNHLSRLLEGGLLLLESQGRHRYYRLAGKDVAAALEALAALRPAAGDGPARSSVPEALRFARTCYDHLAGSLGVAVTEALLGRRYLAEADRRYRTTPLGRTWLASLGLDVGALESGRRPLGRRCLDWSERRPHLAGALGAALLVRFQERQWMVRLPPGRAVQLTVEGRRALERELGMRLL